jgi:cytochrome c-type biogenesis protein CcmE
MTKKQKRMALLAIGLLITSAGIALILSNFKENIVFFLSPTDLAERNEMIGKTIRVGGLIKEGSVSTHQLTTEFQLTDLTNTITIRYKGILPALFREGQGMVAKGIMEKDGIFIAQELLAKHDENYMPPEVAKALKKSGKWKGDAK